MHSSLKHSSQVEVWTLSHHTLILCFFSNSVLELLLCVGYLSCCRVSQQMMSRLTVECFGYTGAHAPLYDCKVPESSGKPSHHPCTTAPDTWYEVFVLTGCVWLFCVFCHFSEHCVLRPTPVRIGSCLECLPLANNPSHWRMMGQIVWKCPWAATVASLRLLIIADGLC